MNRKRATINYKDESCSIFYFSHWTRNEDFMVFHYGNDYEFVNPREVKSLKIEMIKTENSLNQNKAEHGVYA